MQDIIHAPDFLLLQEVGGLGKADASVVQTFPIWAGRIKYTCFHVDTAQGFRQACILVKHPFTDCIHSSVALKVGLVVQLRPKSQRPIFLLTSHFPHGKRADAKDVWSQGIKEVSNLLQQCSPEDLVLYSTDLNQDYTLHYDSFPEMPHFRTVIAQNDLRMQPFEGDTWFARGCSSKIDFFFCRGLGVDFSIQNRADLRLGLPSDHNALILGAKGKEPFLRPSYRKTLCGRWDVDEGRAELAALEHVKSGFDLSVLDHIRSVSTVKPPSLRYVDPPDVKALIDRRKSSTSEEERSRMVLQIHEARRQAKEDHKTNLLELARQGDRRVIGYLKRSSSASATDAGFLQRAGGSLQAQAAMSEHYRTKYTTDDPTPIDPAIQSLFAYHCQGTLVSITCEEIMRHLNKLDARTCTGEDGVPYSLLKSVLRTDLRDEFCQFFNDILRRGKVPDEWKCGRISFIPKTKLPAKPSDLRPICLTSTVAKLFGRILIHRMRKFLPACHALQLGCQPGRQAMDGINTVRAAISVSHRSGRPLCCAKLDIKAAFDSLSHRAITQYLKQGAPNLESLALWDLLHQNEVLLEVGGHSWRQLLTQGILQGTSYSAELFSRVIAWSLAPAISQLQTSAPIMVGGVSFPPMLMYADDILLLGVDPADLQARLRLVQANLATIGLHLNLNKCSTLQGPGGSKLGSGVFDHAAPSPARKRLSS